MHQAAIMWRIDTCLHETVFQHSNEDDISYKKDLYTKR